MVRGKLSSVFGASPKFTDSNQESPTLDLTNDCFRFVTGFFGVISTSAPHIYHSALLLSPKKSIVHKLYGPQVNPLTRVIQGVPTLWDPSIANTRFSSGIHAVAWSPCSRLIAIACNQSCDVAILDAVTLEQLHTMYPQDQRIVWTKLIFSPDSHLLTGYSYNCEYIVSWDLQTGGLISSISTRGAGLCNSMSYSECGTMLGCLFERETIITYDIHSSTQTFSHLVEGLDANTIWTHDKCLQFATVESGSIIVWKISFTSSDPPTQVSTLSTPDNLSEETLALLPIHLWLAFILEERIIVWDAQHQKILLDSMDVKNPNTIYFSPDGHFFMCETDNLEFHLWKKSPDGYLPYQNLTFNAEVTNPVISPNGESIITSNGPILQLWQTPNSSTSPPNISTQASHHTKDILFEFSPDRSLVAFAWQLDNTVTVLNLKSGNSQLVIDAATVICGIGFAEGTIVVVGDGKIITWELPEGGHILNAQRNINDSVQTTPFEHSLSVKDLWASISSDSNYVAFGEALHCDGDLYIYDMHTGKKLVATKSYGWLPGFSPGGKKVWCTTMGEEVNQWAIVGNSWSNNINSIRLKKLGEVEKPLTGFPWHSSCGYQITDDGWVLNSRGKKLLWLPHHWQSTAKWRRKWNGKFLALLDSGFSEPVILELEV